MTTPNILLITQNLQALFQTISRAGGYNNDIKATSVVLDTPPSIAAISPMETPYLVLGHRIEALSRDFATTQPVTIKEKRRIWLEARVDAPTPDTSAKTTALANFEQDIEAVIAAQLPIGGPLFGGGVAMFVEVQTPTYFLGEPEQTQTFIQLPLDVLYRRTFGSP